MADTWVFKNAPNEVNIDDLKKRRIEARLKRDFVEADKIRKEIEAQGYEILDNKDGTTDIVPRGKV
ncbi:MAG: hypothetical protein WC354_06285 [Candidatus Omnitrophota bacterium]|jgi:cysteinyl-tRNA synthetase